MRVDDAMDAGAMDEEAKDGTMDGTKDKAAADCESMDCRKVKEELVFRFVDDEMGQELTIAFRRHVSSCPHCAQETRFTQRLLTIVRERADRRPAPVTLRARILAKLPHRR